MTVEILMTHFQKFDHNEEVVEHVPQEWNLKEGDQVSWELAQFYGVARVVSVAPSPRPGQVAVTLLKVM